MSLLDLINQVAKKNLCKCQSCKTPYDKKSRFVELMEGVEPSYRKVLELHEYCSDECAKHG